MFARLRETLPVLSDEVPEDVEAEDVFILRVYKLAGWKDSDIYIHFHLGIIANSFGPFETVAMLLLRTVTHLVELCTALTTVRRPRSSRPEH